jgi:hypothetical protein
MPTYSITADEIDVNEGTVVTFTVATTEVDNDTTLYWTIAGTDVNTSDFVSSSISGSVNIIGNAASFTTTVRNDTTLEGYEFFIAQLRTDSITGTIVAVSEAILVMDTSTGVVLNDPENGKLGCVSNDFSKPAYYANGVWYKVSGVAIRSISQDVQGSQIPPTTIGFNNVNSMEVIAGYNYFDINFNSDGSISGSGPNFSDTYSGPSTYLTPITDGAGADYEMYLVINYLQPADDTGGLTLAGTFYNSTSPGLTPWVPLTSGQVVQVSSPDRFSSTTVRGYVNIRKKSTGVEIQRYFDFFVEGYDY